MNLLKVSLLAAALAAAPLAAHAESDFVDGAGDAEAKLDFRVTIPRVLFLQVGTGSNNADNTGVDLIEFAPGAASLGNNVAVAGTGGDLGNGAVTARILGNNGTIQLTATADGAGLSNAAGDTIPFSEILTAPTTLTSTTVLDAPALTNGQSAVVTLTPATGKVIERDARWTFSFANSAVYAPGTYGGVNTRGGRVVYTAVMP